LKNWLTGLFIVTAIALGLVNILALEPPGIFVFTDRMVYSRPAQVTVYGVVLDPERNPVPAASLTVEVTNPDGETVFSTEVTTGPDGKFSTSFSLSSEAPEGRYTVVVQESEGTYWPTNISFEVCDICTTPTQQTFHTTITTTTTYTAEITRTQTVYITTTTGTSIIQTTTVTSRETVTATPSPDKATFTTTVTTTQTLIMSIIETSTATVLSEKTTTVTIRESPSYNILLYIGLAIIAVLSITSYFAIKHFKPIE